MFNTRVFRLRGVEGRNLHDGMLSPAITMHTGIFFLNCLLLICLQGPEGPAGPQGAEGPAVSLYYHNDFLKKNIKRQKRTNYQGRIFLIMQITAFKAMWCENYGRSFTSPFIPL